jgi:hypothetical protein
MGSMEANNRHFNADRDHVGEPLFTLCWSVV